MIESVPDDILPGDLFVFVNGEAYIVIEVDAVLGTVVTLDERGYLTAFRFADFAIHMTPGNIGHMKFFRAAP